MKKKIRHCISGFIVTLMIGISFGFAQEKRYSNFKIEHMDSLGNSVSDPVQLRYWNAISYPGDYTNIILPYKELSFDSFPVTYHAVPFDELDTAQFVMVDEVPILFYSLPDDSVVIKVDHTNKLNFSGPDATAYAIQYDLFNMRNEATTKYLAMRKFRLDSTTFLAFHENRFLFEDNLALRQFAQLNKVENRIPRSLSNYLKAEIFGHNYRMKTGIYYSNINAENSRFYERISDKLESRIRNTLKEFYLHYMVTFEEPLDTSVIATSKNYLSFLMLKEKLNLLEHPELTLPDAIKRSYEGVLRDKLMTNYFVQEVELRNLDDGTDHIDRQLAITNDSYSRGLLEYLRKSTVGNRIDLSEYNFTNVDQQQQSLASAKAKTIIIDFWFTGCHGCAQYYADIFSAIKKKFAHRSDLIFVSLSCDKDYNKWITSIDKGIYTSKEAINLFTGPVGHQHPFIKDLNITSWPSVVVMSSNGKILATAEETWRNMDQFTNYLKKLNK